MACTCSSLLPQYPYPSTLNVWNFVSIKLSKTNYLLWKTQMLGLIGSQDLLGFIDGTHPAPAETIPIPVDSSTSGMGEMKNPDYQAWRRSDRLVKGWIIGSISEEVLGVVVGLNTARDVWTELEKTFFRVSQEQVQLERSATTENEIVGDVCPSIRRTVAEKDLSWYLPLYKAALRGDWESANRFVDHDEGVDVAAKITSTSETALHMAVGTGKANHFVEKLVELMPTEALAQQNIRGDTALTLAAMVGNTGAAIILSEKDPALPHIRNKDGFLPLHMAAENAHRDTLLFLLTVTKDDVEPSPFAGQSGLKLLVDVIVCGFYDVALHLVKLYPHLATLKTEEGDSPLTALTRKTSAFPSGSCFLFWQRLIYSCVPVKMENYFNDSNGGDVENPANGSQMTLQMLEGNYFSSGPSVRQKLQVMLWKVGKLLVPEIINIRNKKLIHCHALRLVKCLCDEIRSLNNHHSYRLYIKEPVILAASLDIPEVVEVIVDTFPDAVWSPAEDDIHLFQIAVINRCEKVFNLIYQMSEHRKFLTMVTDTSKNNILHLAGRLAPPHKLNLVSGAALQMQRELQWFKEVEKFVNPVFREKKNSAKETPKMVFTKEHKKLLIEGEKWMKDTADSCSIAATLIATIAFAAAITVPGGNNGDSGLAIFSEEVGFIFFAISDACSLLTSTTSLLMFLSLRTSRYTEEDFIYALPKRLIIMLATLFASIAFMMIAFSSAVSLVSRKIWLLTSGPVILLSGIPITLFVTLQFPLLLDVVASTYGPGFFGRQSCRPFY